MTKAEGYMYGNVGKVGERKPIIDDRFHRSHKSHSAKHQRARSVVPFFQKCIFCILHFRGRLRSNTPRLLDKFFTFGKENLFSFRSLTQNFRIFAIKIGERTVC